MVARGIHEVFKNHTKYQVARLDTIRGGGGLSGGAAGAAAVELRGALECAETADRNESLQRAGP